MTHAERFGRLYWWVFQSIAVMDDGCMSLRIRRDVGGRDTLGTEGFIAMGGLTTINLNYYNGEKRQKNTLKQAKDFSPCVVHCLASCTSSMPSKWQPGCVTRPTTWQGVMR